MARVALIGLGMVSDTYAAAIASAPGLDLAAVHARTQAARDRFQAAHPSLGAMAVASLADLVAVPDLDFAILATPPNARHEAIAALSAAGIPILMEKPIERSLAQAESVVDMCAAAGIQAGLMLQHRARPAVSNLRSILPEIGALCAVEVTVPWWRDQSYYDAPGRGTYARDGGGVLMSQAIHTLDLMLHIAGPVVEVTAMAATTSLHKMEAEDFVTAGLRFANGAVGHVFASTASFPGRGERLVFHGANGSAVLEAGLVQINWRDGRSDMLGVAAASGAGADPMAFTSDWHQSVIEDFADAVAQGRAPNITARDGLAVHRLIGGIERAAKLGHRIELES
ncbi:MAG: Gfo/Idh/MocA family oxidoreductase [Pseudomonadota bacterium]